MLRPVSRSAGDRFVLANLVPDAVLEDAAADSDPNALSCRAEEGEEAHGVGLIFRSGSSLRREHEAGGEHADPDAPDDCDADPDPCATRV